MVHTPKNYGDIKRRDYITRRRMPSCIDSMIDQLDIYDVAKRLGIKFKYRTKPSNAKRNHDSFALCPFHDERSPSFSVSHGKQFYYCFGCGAGGNVIHLVMEFKRIDYEEAVNFLRKNYTIKGLEYGNYYKQDYFTLSEAGDEFSQRVIDVIYKRKEEKYEQFHGRSFQEVITTKK